MEFHKGRPAHLQPLVTSVSLFARFFQARLVLLLLLPRLLLRDILQKAMPVDGESLTREPDKAPLAHLQLLDTVGSLVSLPEHPPE